MICEQVPKDTTHTVCWEANIGSLDAGQVAALSSLRMYVAKDLRQAEPRAAAVAQLAEVLRRFPSGPPVRVGSCTRAARAVAEHLDGMHMPGSFQMLPVNVRDAAWDFEAFSWI
jgi:rRNA-processing arch domain